jgi:hypothetical protein
MDGAIHAARLRKDPAIATSGRDAFRRARSAVSVSGGMKDLPALQLGRRA